MQNAKEKLLAAIQNLEPDASFMFVCDDNNGALLIAEVSLADMLEYVCGITKTIAARFRETSNTAASKDFMTQRLQCAIDEGFEKVNGTH